MQYEINTTGGNATLPILGNNSSDGRSYDKAMSQFFRLALEEFLLVTFS